MKMPPDSTGEDRLKQLRLYLYFLPVLGFFPALWHLYRRQGDRQGRNDGDLASPRRRGSGDHEDAESYQLCQIVR